ncbi:hypothetical protein ACFQMB_18445 [Pseudobowmanella zhangzhouensis]|uniref:hypothetical protein n=1 Tax=Pseudobowmanella zhangzhouensis TaxID=1537679 RepID=UPI00361C7DFB
MNNRVFQAIFVSNTVRQCVITRISGMMPSKIKRLQWCHVQFPSPSKLASLALYTAIYGTITVVGDQSVAEKARIGKNGRQ